MVLPTNLEIILPLSGLMLGIALGMIGGFSREEKVRISSISTFGVINVAFIGISFYAYGYSLDVPLWFLFCSSLSFVVMFMLGVYYHKQQQKGSGAGVIELSIGERR